MDQSEKKRKLIVGGALVATLIAAVLVEEEETVIDTVDTIQPVKPSGDRVKNQENNIEQLDVSKLGQRKFSSLAGELFASTTWAPKQPQVNLQEQAAIAQLLRTATDEIEVLSTQLAQLRTQKRALMQKLLSGDWRLPETPLPKGISA